MVVHQVTIKVHNGLTMAPWRLTMATWRLTMVPWRLTETVTQRKIMVPVLVLIAANLYGSCSGSGYSSITLPQQRKFQLISFLRYRYHKKLHCLKCCYYKFALVLQDDQTM
jgi:hypothetical protein